MGAHHDRLPAPGCPPALFGCAPAPAGARRADREPAPVGPSHEAYGWFRDHIQDHFHEWHKVSDYAERLGYSSRTLNRLARQYTGLSAKQLIDERVVLEAKRLLAHGDGAASEIALSLGFDDASNFSSYFRRHTHMTPGTFRTRSRVGHATSPAEEEEITGRARRPSAVPTIPGQPR